MNKISFLSPAKINLGLKIGEKRDNNRHRLQTVMATIPLFDEIELDWNTDKNSTIFCANQLVPNNSNNLIIQAFSLLQHDFSLPGVQINLKKKIPLGAGLGGGSFDAGTLLKVLNRELKLNLTQNQLLGYAQKIGSDVSFAVSDAPMILENNHGCADLEQFYLPALPACQIVLISPTQPMLTKTAFDLWDQANLQDSLTDLTPLINACRNQDLKQIAQNLANDFERVIFNFSPNLAEIKNQLLVAGALGALMTGSGSSLFGIFSPQVPPQKIKKDLSQYQPLILSLN